MRSASTAAARDLPALTQASQLSARWAVYPTRPWRARAGLARICLYPYDRLHSVPVRDDDPSERMAELGDSGFIEFTVDEAEGLVGIYSLVWLG